MQYNFDRVIDRRGSNSLKWEAGDMLKRFGLTERFDEETIALWVADMDFPCPAPVIEALHARVDRLMFGYSSYQTSPDYVEAIQGWFQRRHDWEIPVEAIVYSPGTVTALDAVVKTFSAEGDGVIVQRPVYRPFISSVEANNRRVVSNSLVNDDNCYSIDFDDFERLARDPRTPCSSSAALTIRSAGSGRRRSWSGWPRSAWRTTLS